MSATIGVGGKYVGKLSAIPFRPSFNKFRMSGKEWPAILQPVQDGRKGSAAVLQPVQDERKGVAGYIRAGNKGRESPGIGQFRNSGKSRLV